MIKLFTNKKEHKLFIIDFYYGSLSLKLFTIIWCIYQVFVYNEISKRPSSLFEPVIWFQKILTPTLPNQVFYYSIITITILLCVLSIYKNKIVLNVLIFISILWLNTIKWNYGFFSHVGHTFVLAHFFSMLLPIPLKLKTNQIQKYSNSIKLSLAGVLITYTMAGSWKFIMLAYKLIFKPHEINWLNENAVELNAIVSARLWDEKISDLMLSIYDIPYIWEIGTVFIFTVQLIAVLGALNKKLSYFIISNIILFHIYNTLFINTSFYVAMITLIILFFPYHKLTFLKNRFSFEN